MEYNGICVDVVEAMSPHLGKASQQQWRLHREHAPIRSWPQKLLPHWCQQVAFQCQAKRNCGKNVIFLWLDEQSCHREVATRTKRIKPEDIKLISSISETAMPLWERIQTFLIQVKGSSLMTDFSRHRQSPHQPTMWTFVSGRFQERLEVGPGFGTAGFLTICGAMRSWNHGMEKQQGPWILLWKTSFTDILQISLRISTCFYVFLRFSEIFIQQKPSRLEIVKSNPLLHRFLRKGRRQVSFSSWPCNAQTYGKSARSIWSWSFHVFICVFVSGFPHWFLAVARCPRPCGEVDFKSVESSWQLQFCRTELKANKKKCAQPQTPVHAQAVSNFNPSESLLVVQYLPSLFRTSLL